MFDFPKLKTSKIINFTLFQTKIQLLPKKNLRFPSHGVPEWPSGAGSGFPSPISPWSAGSGKMETALRGLVS